MIIRELLRKSINRHSIIWRSNECSKFIIDNVQKSSDKIRMMQEILGTFHRLTHATARQQPEVSAEGHRTSQL